MDVNGGLVPVLESPDGTFIYESQVLCDFASDHSHDEGMSLWPHQKEKSLQNDLLTAKMRLQILKFNSFLSHYWGAHRARYEDDNLNQNLIQVLKSDIQPFFVKNTNKNSGNFLSGSDGIMMIDINCFPIVDRLVLLENSPWHHVFEILDLRQNAPAIFEYTQMFRENEVMAPHVMKPECYHRHLER